LEFHEYIQEHDDKRNSYCPIALRVISLAMWSNCFRTHPVIGKKLLLVTSDLHVLILHKAQSQLHVHTCFVDPVFGFYPYLISLPNVTTWGVSQILL